MLKQNPTFNPNLPESATNQRMIFDVPQGWDTQTYQNFKNANPTLEPNTQDTALMMGTSTPTITPEALAPVMPTDLPKAPQDWYNYGGITAENGSIADLFKSIGVEEKPTDLTAMFKNLYSETGLATQEQGVLEKEKAKQSAQNEFNLINAQLKALTDQYNAVPTAIQQASEGRGITVGGAAPLTAAKQREIALQSLPLQGQAYLAQAKVLAAQGDVETSQKALEIATSKFNTVFTIQSKQAEMDYEYRKDLRDKVYEYATAKEKEKLAALQKEDDRKFTLLQNNLNYAQQLSRDALSVGQAELAAQITALDPNSKTYTQDLAKVAGQIKQKEDLQYVSGTENQPAGYFDKATGKFTPIAGGGDNIGIDNTLNGEYGDIIKSAANLVGATRGKTSQKSIAQSIANQDWTSAYAQVANNVEESLTGTSKSKFADTRTDYSVMLGLKNAVQSYANSGGDMGLLTGKEEDIKRKLGIDSGKASALAVQLWREFQTYRVNMTGAAFSEAESRDYAAVNPTLGKSLNLNLSIIEGALNQMENRITSTINTRVPNAKKLYDKVQGKITQLDPATAPIGSTIEIDGKKYIKLEEDKFEEQIYSFNPTGK